jgi:hypothetical protein
MDTEILEDIKFFALDAYSENLVKARMNITRLRESINNPETHVNTAAQAHQQLETGMKQYNTARITMAKKKHEVLQKLIKKYPSLEEALIRTHLDAAITEYETDEINKTVGVVVDVPFTLPKPEMATITIPVYATPTRQDMAVLLVYFNACSYKKLAQNLLLTYQTLVRAGIPVYLVEHCFPGQVPLMPANGTTIFNTKSESHMFYKENLLNWLMRKIPQQYTKFYTMDSDLIFDKETWYDDVSVLLDTHDVVQPFHTAFWLGSDLKSINFKREGVVSAKGKGLTLTFLEHHPGFTWAFKRDFIEPKGIFDLNLMGSGDCVIASCVLQTDINNRTWLKTSGDWILEKYDEYFKLFEENKATFYQQTVYHLWHGSRDNRGYNQRDIDFEKGCLKHAITKFDELLILNDDGLYEYHPLVRDTMDTITLKYFQSRHEDGI